MLVLGIDITQLDLLEAREGVAAGYLDFGALRLQIDADGSLFLLVLLLMFVLVFLVVILLMHMCTAGNTVL